MTPETFVLLATIVIGSLIFTLGNWRLVFLGVILAGFGQDPLRKMVPGEPVYFVALCTAVMALALFGAITRHGPVSLAPVISGNAATRIVLVMAVSMVAVQALLSWIRFGSAMIAGIGLLSYLSPIPAIWLAYHYTRGTPDVRRFLAVYVACSVVVAVSIYLSKLGVETRLFAQVGEALAVYDPEAGRVEIHAGFMRTAEVAAWHVGAGLCMLIVWAVSFRNSRLQKLTPVLVVLFLGAGVLTGRRKMLIVVVSFAVLYAILLYYYRQRSARRAFLVVATMSVTILGAALFLAPGQGTFRPYVTRGQSVFGDASERFVDLGLASVSWAIEAGGFFGLGAGAGSQGSQHFSGGEVLAGGAAEGGLGKIVVELGVLGLTLVVLAFALVARNLRRILEGMRPDDPLPLPLCLGLVAFVAANIPVFVGASQIYGDPFVLILLGSYLGFVFASPRSRQLSRSAQQLRQSARSVDRAGTVSVGPATAASFQDVR
jgi:hypothetical protein